MSRIRRKLSEILTSLLRARGPDQAHTPPVCGGDGAGRRLTTLLVVVSVVISAAVLPVLGASNTVDWTGEVNLDATATDGTQLTYDMTDVDSASDYYATFTGIDNTETDTVSASAVSNGGTVALDVAGHGKAATSASVTFTGNGFKRWDNQTHTGLSDGATISYGVDGNLEPLGDSANGQPTLTLTGQNDIDAAYIDGNNNVKIVDTAGNIKDLGVNGYGVGGIGDVDGDGDLDVAFRDTSDNLKYVDASGNVADTGAQTGRSPGAIADWDGDGDQDIVYVDNNQNIKYVDSAGNVADTGAQGKAVGDGLGDVDGDGDLDVASRDPSTNDLEYVDSAGNVVTMSDTTGDPGGIADWDGDGDQDILYKDKDQNIATIDDAGNIQSIAGGADAAGAFADVDNDGDIDAVYSNGDVYYEDSNGNSQSFGVSSVDAGGVADVNDDTTTDPGIDIDGDGTDEVSHSGTLTGSKTFEISSLGTGDDSWSVSLSGGTVDVSANVKERKATQDPGIDVDGDGTDDASYTGNLFDGDTATKSLPDLALSDDSATISTAEGTVDVSVTYTEHSVTDSADLKVNSNWYNTSTTLSDGTSTNLSVSTSALQSGTNTVTTDMPSVSADAPPMQVDLHYTHDAADNVSVNATVEQLSEQYNVSHKYSSARDNATLTVDFQDAVYDIVNIEKRVNGGSWSAVADSDYSLSGTTTLTVQLGDVAKNDKVEIRTTGRKVDVHNGAITVNDPSTPSSELDSKITIDAWASDSYIEIPKTKNWQLVHYTYNESWNADEKTRIDENRYQRLTMPNVAAGDTARLSTIPIEANPTNGDVAIKVIDPSSTEPEFKVLNGKKLDDTVKYTHTQAKDDTKYILYSITHDVVLDQGTASSPLTLEDDDSEETIEFRIDDGGSSDSDGGGSSGFWGGGTRVVQQASAVQPLVSPTIVSGLLILLVGGAYAVSEYVRRSNKPLWKRQSLRVAVPLALFVGILLIAPSAIAGPVESFLSIALSLGAVALVFGGAYLLYRRQQRKQTEAATPEAVIRVGGRIRRLGRSSDSSGDDGDGGLL